MTTIAQPFPSVPGPRLAAVPATRPRVLYLLEEYPAAGQTHIASEIAALEAEYEIGILALRPAARAYAGHHPHRITPSLAEIVAAAEAFAPDVLHAHNFGLLGLVGTVARTTGTPFTVRTHSADVMTLRPEGLGARIARVLRGGPAPESTPAFAETLATIDSELCLGVLALPFARPWLARAGVREAKLVDCFPVVAFERFHDRSDNDDAVMTISTAADGRHLNDFLRLARKVPGRGFNCYAPNGDPDALAAQAARSGAAVAFPAPVAPADMPREYKKHRWLVLTGAGDATARGWPMAIAEAQAAGVGVCMPALRRDLAHYIGEGAGILYDSIDELPAIVSGPVPEEMRNRGFEQARKSDIARHKHLLTDLWEDSLRSRAPAFARALTGAGAHAPAQLLRAAAVPHMASPA